MLKLVLKIKETSKDKVLIEMKQLTEKEFNSSSELEKYTASEIKQAIEVLVTKIKKENMKEGE